ncbi:hypothetical protein ONQ62_25630, partial [Salmonella enterica subsp. enterica serovar Virginia]|nr:hypothetical protein [Salmonella enterica subsp. enterica serovar Virginia]
FDVQRDHVALMKDLKRLLRKGGTIMFSNNKRGFRMDLEGLAEHAPGADSSASSGAAVGLWPLRRCVLAVVTNIIPYILSMAALVIIQKMANVPSSKAKVANFVAFVGA